MKRHSKEIDPLDFARVLADPTRQAIMRACCCRWLSVTELVAAVGVSQPTVSHHLGVLREVGLVSVRRVGKHAYYHLSQEQIAVCCGQILHIFAPETPQAEAIKEGNHG